MKFNQIMTFNLQPLATKQHATPFHKKRFCEFRVDKGSQRLAFLLTEEICDGSVV